MTALDDFQRLEAPGIWRRDDDTQRRDVIVLFGEASLTISSGRDVAISHWSLAAVRRLNPGQRPALYAPGSDHAETLEIDDETMIASIAKVQKSIERKGPHPRRLRVLSIAAAVIVLAGLLFFWLPMAMITYTASVVPQTKRADIGEALLGHIQRLTGAPCDTALRARALADLQARLRPDSPGRIVVLRDGALPTRHLPGTIILLNRTVVEDHENPDVTAGYVLAEVERLSVSDPLRDMLERLGLRAAFELLTTGNLHERRLQTYAELVLTAPQPTTDNAALLDRFRTAEVPSTPYAFAIDITGETTIGLIEADPVTATIA